MLDGKKTYLALFAWYAVQVYQAATTGDPGLSEAEIVSLVELAAGAGVIAAGRDALRKVIEARRKPVPSGREMR